MKVLSIGTDTKALSKDSDLVKRLKDYGDLVEKYIVVVPSLKVKEVKINEKVSVFGSGGANKIFQFLKMYFLAKKIIKNNNIEVITTQDSYFVGLLGVLLSKKLNKGLEVQIHGLEEGLLLKKKIMKYVLPKADVIRVVSERIKQYLIDNFKVEEEKVVVVPIYVDLSPKDRVESSSDKFIFLTVSRLEPVKNISLQLQAMEELSKERDDIELWIVGDGSEKENIRKEIANLSLDKIVKILGWKDRDELNKLYRESDCFILTSNREGWGMVVLEAASFGLPVIMTDVGLAGEVIKNNESGLVISVGDINELSGAIKKVLGNKKFVRDIVEGARISIGNLPSKSTILESYKKSWHKAFSH